MATRAQEILNVRRAALWFALIGVAVGVILYLVGGQVATFLASQRTPQAPAAVVLQVSNDANANSVIDLAANEHGVEGVTLKVTGPQYAKVTTDAAGYAKLSNLVAGTYQVSATLHDEVLAISPNQITLESGKIQSIPTLVNAAGSLHGSISGRLTSLDTTGSSTPIRGATVSLDQGNSLITQGLTEIDGLYIFDGLDAGLYRVRIDLTDGSFRELLVNLRSVLDSYKQDVEFAEPTADLSTGNQIILAARSSADLQVLKLASDADELPQEFISSQPGGLFLYTITLKTLGGPATIYPDLKLVDDYPTGIRVSNISGSGVDSGGTITWDLGAVTGAQTIEVSYTGQLDSNAADGNYRNVVVASATGFDSVEDDSTVISKAPTVTSGSQTSNTVVTTPTTSTQDSGGSGASGQQTVPRVGIDARSIAFIAALPIAAVATIIGLGLRRATS